MMSINSLKPVRPKGYWFYRCVWDFFGRRHYGRNTNEVEEIFRGFVALIFAMLATLFFQFFPFRWTATLVFIPFIFLAMFRPVWYANKTSWVGFVNVVVGALGLLMHWQFGLTLFTYHFEFLIFWGFLAGGVLTFYRRAWNALIWKLLDKSGRQGVIY